MSEIIARCQNCGTPTPVRAMLRDRADGSYHCVECPGEGWLRERYGPYAVAELVALRHGDPGALTLPELVATYPEKPGYFRKHRLTAA